MTEKELEALKKNSLYSIEFSHEHKDAVTAKKITDLNALIKRYVSKEKVLIFIFRLPKDNH
jgi:hypothetical protein